MGEGEVEGGIGVLGGGKGKVHLLDARVVDLLRRPHFGGLHHAPRGDDDGGDVVEGEGGSHGGLGLVGECGGCACGLRGRVWVELSGGGESRRIRKLALGVGSCVSGWWTGFCGGDGVVVSEISRLRSYEALLDGFSLKVA